MNATHIFYVNSHTISEEVLNGAIETFRRKGDVREFMERSAPHILRYIKRLNCDPDIAGDFYLHFYERADRFLEVYNRNDHIPIRPFLYKYLKNEFFNFIRIRKTRMLNIYPSSDSRCLDEELIGEREDRERQIADRHKKRLFDRVNRLPIKYRLPIKLYFGFSLNASDLRYLLSKIPEEMNAEIFLEEFERRIALTASKFRKLENRAARLNLMIHSTSDTDRSLRWRRMKRRIERYLRRNTPVYSLQELGNALGLSKTTVFRQIRSASRIVIGKEVQR